MNEVGLGAALQQARKNKGLTQQQLCGVTGLSYSTLAKIERGAIKSPSIFTVSQITNALGVSIDEIIGSTKTPTLNQKKTAKNGVKFVYFDINGCLISHHSAFTRIAEDCGRGVEQIEYIYWKYNDAVCKGEMKVKELDLILGKELDLPDFSWKDYYLSTVKPIKPLQDLIITLEKDFRVGLLSNVMEGLVESLFDSGKLPKLPYDQIIDSSKVGLIKPDKDIFELATKAVGVEPNEILFIDDTRTNLSAASQIGWRTLLFDPYDAEVSVQNIREALV